MHFGEVRIERVAEHEREPEEALPTDDRDLDRRPVLERRDDRDNAAGRKDDASDRISRRCQRFAALQGDEFEIGPKARGDGRFERVEEEVAVSVGLGCDGS